MSAKPLSEISEYALSFYGKPYIWGGDFKTIDGGDCSGLILRILQFANAAPKGDHSSHMLYEWMKREGAREYLGEGALAFFGTTTRISHVGYLLTSKIMISAAGGGSWCTTVPAAKARDAWVKIQPLSIYKAPPFVASIFPYYP